MANLKEISAKAVEIQKDKILTMEAQKIYDKIFSNKLGFFDRQVLFVPSYLDIITKEKFYKSGGDCLKQYSSKEYARLLDIPEPKVLEWVDTRPEFFIFLHEKREFVEEINTIVLILARQVFNEFSNSSPRDKASLLNSLAKFSSLMNPKVDEEDGFEKELSKIKDPSQLKELMRNQGLAFIDEVEKVSDNIQTGDILVDE